MLRSGHEHSPMRIAGPFIMIIHVIGSLRVIRQFAPYTRAVLEGFCGRFSHHLNRGTLGTVRSGCGSGAILEALPTPLLER
jgi:hypothetical protein